MVTLELKGLITLSFRYFLLVVAVYAHAKNKEFLVCANVSERIIVRVGKCLSFIIYYKYNWCGHYRDVIALIGRELRHISLLARKVNHKNFS